MNGLYNLETHELEPHDPQRYLTSQLGFAYEPAADSPCFDGFLRSVLTDNETYWFILEAIGYSVTDDTRRRASFWLVGPSASGKSTLLNVIIALAGSSHAGINLNELNQNSYAAAAIAGKRLVTFTEPDSNSVLPDGQYKRLVSSDTVTARMPYGKPFDFVPQAKLWGAMNEPPRVYDRSEAVFDRVYIIPFPRSIPVNERDYELEEKLKAEVAGIFNTAMFGLKRLQRNNGFTHSKVIEAARREFRNDNDTEAQFIEDMCQLRGEVDSQALYESYRGWCLRNGNQPKGKRRVGSDFKRFGVTSRKSNGRTIYTGITLRAMT